MNITCTTKSTTTKPKKKILTFLDIFYWVRFYWNVFTQINWYIRLNRPLSVTVRCELNIDLKKKKKKQSMHAVELKSQTVRHEAPIYTTNWNELQFCLIITERAIVFFTLASFVLYELIICMDIDGSVLLCVQHSYIQMWISIKDLIAARMSWAGRVCVSVEFDSHGSMSYVFLCGPMMCYHHANRAIIYIYVLVLGGFSVFLHKTKPFIHEINVYWMI